MIQAREPRGDLSSLPNVIHDGRVAAYLEDAAHVPGGHAAGLVLPGSERDVAEALSASDAMLVVGAQSSLTGGATPRGETLLSTARLRAITDLPDGRIRAGAGVTISDIDRWLQVRGAVYPPAPTWHGATIGGTIATNAAGAATFKYGTTRAWVDGLTVVLASGDVLEIVRGRTTAHPGGYFELGLRAGTVRVPLPTYRMPQVPKLSAGYFAAPGMDLIDLFIGAEGTLGVVTDAVLRVQHQRPAVCLAFTTFRERGTALAFVARLRDTAMQTWRTHDAAGVDVAAIEHLDARSLAIVREDGVDRRLGITLDPEAAIGLLVALDLPMNTTADAVYDAFGSALVEPPEAASGSWRAGAPGLFARLLQEFGAASDTLVAAPGDVRGLERLVALREAVPLGLNERIGRAKRDVDPRIDKTAADVIVPFDRFEAMLDVYDEELRRRRLDGAIWGHISDGNVHPNIIPRSFDDVESGRQAVLAFGRAAIRLGGAPLAEHGVGRNATKQQLLRELYGDHGIEEMRRVKRALDPRWKLAPGVIFSAV